MKTVLILSFLIVASVLLLFILGVSSRSGKSSGLVAGRLAKCPATPNCVCSEPGEEGGHFIDPILLPHDITLDPLPILKKVVQEMGGTVEVESAHYFTAVFSSAIFGFRDDLEVKVDLPQQVVHLRSASRVGYGDAGVNRKRIELLKKLYRQKLAEVKP